jgi:hypothetical protein
MASVRRFASLLDQAIFLVLDRYKAHIGVPIMSPRLYLADLERLLSRPDRDKIHSLRRFTLRIFVKFLCFSSSLNLVFGPVYSGNLIEFFPSFLVIVFYFLQKMGN